MKASAAKQKATAAQAEATKNEEEDMSQKLRAITAKLKAEAAKLHAMKQEEEAEKAKAKATMAEATVTAAEARAARAQMRATTVLEEVKQKEEQVLSALASATASTDTEAQSLPSRIGINRYIPPKFLYILLKYSTYICGGLCIAGLMFTRVPTLVMAPQSHPDNTPPKFG